MNWKLVYLPKALKDLENLDHSQQIAVRKAIEKVNKNPLPNTEGGYGKPLGNKGNLDLKGCLKIKLKSSGLRAVYRLIRTEKEMQMIVIGLRADEEVYKIAYKRLKEIEE